MTQPTPPAAASDASLLWTLIGQLVSLAAINYPDESRSLAERIEPLLAAPPIAQQGGGEVTDAVMERIAREMAHRAMAKRNHFEYLAHALNPSYNERDAGLRFAYDNAARMFGELAYQVADQFRIPGSEIDALASKADGGPDINSKEYEAGFKAGMKFKKEQLSTPAASGLDELAILADRLYGINGHSVSDCVAIQEISEQLKALAAQPAPGVGELRERILDSLNLYYQLGKAGHPNESAAKADELAALSTRPAESVAQGAPDLHPETADLVRRFSVALAAKLAKDEKKYGYADEWKSPDWMDECRSELVEHINKGDPRDVAAYCAFLWHHGESTTLDPDAPTPATGSGGEEVSIGSFMGRRATPEGTREFWGDLAPGVKTPTRGTELFAHPAGGDAGDAARLDWLEANEADLVTHRESENEAGEYSIWWNVVKRGESISGHPLGEVREAIDFAMNLTAKLGADGSK